MLSLPSKGDWPSNDTDRDWRNYFMVETRLSAIRNDDRGATSQSQTKGNNQSDHSLTKAACLCTLLVLFNL